MSQSINQGAVYIHVCPDINVSMTVNSSSHMDVAAKKLNILKCGCFIKPQGTALKLIGHTG